MTKKASQLSRIAAAISVATLFGCGGGATTSTDIDVVDPAAPVSDWELVWSDEFDGNSIDDDNWTHEVNCDGGGNNESQCYTDSEDNSFVSDGSLKIVALPAEEGAQKPYTSARLNTRYKADFKYGRIEMRAKLPSGQGSWPAFWMMPTDEAGLRQLMQEIRRMGHILEHFPGNAAQATARAAAAATRATLTAAKTVLHVHDI